MTYLTTFDKLNEARLRVRAAKFPHHVQRSFDGVLDAITELAYEASRQSELENKPATKEEPLLPGEYDPRD